MSLVRTEGARVLFHVVYAAYLVLVLLSWKENYAGLTGQEIRAAEAGETAVGFDAPVLARPEPGAEYYGSKQVEDPEKLMTGGTDMLLLEYQKNEYTTYPLGYYRAVTLSEEDQAVVLGILKEITGLSEEELLNLPDHYFPQVNGMIFHASDELEAEEDGSFRLNPRDSVSGEEYLFEPKVSYERFLELMGEMEELLGPGSNYSMESLITYFGITDRTYEEAVEQYELTIESDQVAGGFARLFCDYMAGPAGLYPAFLAVFVWYRDRRKGIREVIWSKRISSVRLVFSRFLAVVGAALLPMFVLSLESLIPLVQFGARQDLAVNVFAFVEYILWWLLPTVMVSAALGGLITILTDTPAGILVCFAWWQIERGMTGLTGDVSLWTLMIRHNTLRGAELIEENLGLITANRLLMAGLALLLVGASAYILSLKRRGRLHAAERLTSAGRLIRAKLPA